jgi:hypothetical protein
MWNMEQCPKKCKRFKYVPFYDFHMGGRGVYKLISYLYNEFQILGQSAHGDIRLIYRYFRKQVCGFIIGIFFGRSILLAIHKVAMQLHIHSKAVEVDQAAGVDLRNTGSPSPLDIRRINRYPHLQPLDTCYDVLCDSYTYQVRTCSACLFRPLFFGDVTLVYLR